MGFDLNRFSKEIDNEFLCMICASVLEEAVQSPKCEHHFCSECIIQWITINKTCPIDRAPLRFNDLKPISRPLRNLLNKLKINCDFHSSGCIDVIELEKLQHHRNMCSFNPNREVTCDKGCGLKMDKIEYENTNCISHMGKQIAELSKKFEILVKRPQMWQMCNGIKFGTSDPNILEYSNKMPNVSMVQSIDSLTPDKSYFQIEILALGDSKIIVIGLTCKNYPIDRHPGWNKKSIAYHGDDGKLYNGDDVIDGGMGMTFGPIWVKGDVIECGIKIPQNNSNLGIVYFKRNQIMIGEKCVRIPRDGFYPTVSMGSAGAKVKFIDY